MKTAFLAGVLTIASTQATFAQTRLTESITTKPAAKNTTTVLTATQNPVFLGIPGRGQTMFGVGSTYQKSELQANYQSTSFGSKGDGARLDFGFVHNFNSGIFVGAKNSYAEAKTNQDSGTDSSSKGFADPSFRVGAMTEGPIRLKFQLELSPSSGDSESEDNGSEKTSNNKRGGDKMTPSVAFLSETKTSYFGADFIFSPESDTEEKRKSSTGVRYKSQRSGGGSWTLSTYLESKSSMKPGAGLFYNKLADSKVKEVGATGYNSTYTSRGSSMMGISAYIAPQISPQTRVIPSLSYVTLADRNEFDGIEIKQYDVFAANVELRTEF